MNEQRERRLNDTVDAMHATMIQAIVEAKATEAAHLANARDAAHRLWQSCGGDCRRGDLATAILGYDGMTPHLRRAQVAHDVAEWLATVALKCGVDTEAVSVALDGKKA